MKRKIVNLLMVLFITSITTIGFTQSVHPPFPSNSQAIKDLKSHTGLMSRLKKEHGISASQLNFKVYRGFKLSYSRKLWPYKNRFDEDICEIIFETTVTENGLTYDFLWFASYNCAVITGKNIYYKNNWTYDTQNSAYQLQSLKGGKKEVSDQERIDFLTNILNKCDGEKKLTKDKHGVEGDIRALTDFIEFNGQITSEEEDTWKSSNEKIWHLKVHGVAVFRDYSEPEIIKKIGKNAWAEFDITVNKNSAGKWIAKQISTSTQYNSPKEFNEIVDYYGYGEKSYKELLNKRYKKALTAKNEALKKQRAKEMNEAFNLLHELKYEEFIEAMKKLVYKGDQKIIDSYVNIYQYPYKRLCSVSFYANTETYYTNNETNKPRTVLSWEVKRKSIRYDKKLAKYYKENGMSKDVLKSTEGNFNKSYEQKLSMEFIDGNWWITQPAKSMEIPF